MLTVLKLEVVIQHLEYVDASAIRKVITSSWDTTKGTAQKYIVGHI